MDLATFHELLTDRGQAALREAMALEPREEHFLSLLGPLQKRYGPALAKAALETAILRRKAQAKFARAEAMYFTREALEQASGEAISRYRAGRYARLGGAAPGHVADLGCGIGGDTLGLAAAGLRVTAVEQDALRLAMAAENLGAYGLREQAQWVAGDARQVPWPAVDGFFFDPARRAGGRRKFSVREYEPPLATLVDWLARAPAGGAKISPGVDLAELAGYDCEIEFISEAGELKECALWFGPLKTAARRATLLPEPHTLALGVAEALPAATVGEPDAFLYEPDAAVLRAGLVGPLAQQLGAHQLDADIAYLAAPDVRPTPFARAFAIDEAMPFQLKRLRERLRALDVGEVTVKKRGSPLEPEALIKQLRLKGSERRVVFLTHVRGEAWVLVGRRVEEGGKEGVGAIG